MDEVIDWINKNLVTQVPRDIPVWHWSNADAVNNIRSIAENGGTFDRFNRGAVGRGLYVSTSAVDLMDRGNEIFYARLRSESAALIIEPALFNVGVPELFGMMLMKSGWSDYRCPRPEPGIKEYLTPDVPGVIDRLLAELKIPCCVYAFGLYLTFMVRDGSCLEYDKGIDPASTVITYHRAHPKEVPMLAPDRLNQWLAAQNIPV